MSEAFFSAYRRSSRYLLKFSEDFYKLVVARPFSSYMTPKFLSFLDKNKVAKVMCIF